MDVLSIRNSSDKISICTSEEKQKRKLTAEKLKAEKLKRKLVNNKEIGDETTMCQTLIQGISTLSDLSSLADRSTKLTPKIKTLLTS